MERERREPRGHRLRITWGRIIFSISSCLSWGRSLRVRSEILRGEGRGVEEGFGEGASKG